MNDAAILAGQARQIHTMFMGLYYPMVLSFLALGLVLEYFNWPLGRTPGFAQLIGRALIATILLNAYPEITNTIANIADAIATQLGDLNQFNLVRERMADKLHQFTLSWLSIKDGIIMVISLLCFFLLYFSVFIAEAFFMYVWTLLYVLSPVLIALYVLPSTSQATRALFRSLIEVASWKVVWSILATLLWSLALGHLTDNAHVNFLSVIGYSLILAASLLTTPLVIHALAGAGMTAMASSLGGVTVGSARVTPASVKSYVTKKVAGRMSRDQRRPSMNSKSQFKSSHRTIPVRTNTGDKK